MDWVRMEGMDIEEKVGPGGQAWQGELRAALSSIAALGLVEFTTRAKGERQTVSKVIKVGLCFCMSVSSAPAALYLS